MRTLVTGATGYVGSRLVTELLAAGHDVVVASRTPDRLKLFGWYADVTPVHLDVLDQESTAAALQSLAPVDVVYYLVHSIGQDDFRDTDNQAAHNLAVAAGRAEVTRIVYLGGFVPDGDRLSEHLTSRAEVARELQVPDGPELVWLKAAVVIGAGSTSFEMVRYIGDRLLLIPMPSWVDNPMEPISIRDVLYYLVAAAEPELPAGAYDISGGQPTTYRGLITSYLDAVGKYRVGVPIPLVSTKIAAQIGSVLVPVPTGLAADLVVSLDHPMVAGEHRIRGIVPDPSWGLTGMDDAVEASVTSMPPRPVNRLIDPHHLADSDPVWAGGDWPHIRLVGSHALGSGLWKSIENLGGRAVLSRWPVAAPVRVGLDAGLDVLDAGLGALGSLAGRVADAGRSSRRRAE
ncbi:NAD(P)H-binding protein [Williamsia sterculiae]|uniref:Uncharacterized conserved protein YbjT, contains NAD(P)-binding and DUF2867 domains n=1 Tax=Williamsia sterculiae TaxID=1344003 RepID=A0A1N7FCY4_9NOCA|nr:NAD(P)H-binding protein [Williamsia sterculiae]SIR98162.1 Uncharacterized conserved protein YbjT, contains NAD(P)-binding and DUF2867 domains [Williamsia sterculiae]